MHVSKSY